MKKQLAFSTSSISQNPIEITKISDISEMTEPLQLNKLEALAITENLLKSIKEYCKNQTTQYHQTLTKLNQNFKISFSEKAITQIDKFQHFYSNPFILRVNGNTYSSIISPYQLNVATNAFISCLGCGFYWSLYKYPNQEREFIEHLDYDNQLYKTFIKDFNKKILVFFSKKIKDSNLSITTWDTLVLFEIADNLTSSFIFSLFELFGLRDNDRNLFNRFIIPAIVPTQSLLFGIIVMMNTETSLNPITSYSSLSNQFDQLIQEMGKSNLKSDFYSPDLSIETYCTYSSIVMISLMTSLLLRIVNYNRILDLLKYLLKKLTPETESPITKLQTEKEKIETEMQNQLTQWLEPIKELPLSKKEQDTLILDIKKQAILHTIETLETTIPRSTSTFSQRSDSRLKLAMNFLLQKIENEKITEQDSNETIEQKFSHIQAILQDPILFEIPLFPILHLEAHANLFGLRELTTIHIQETRIPKDDHFQETVSDRNNLNRLIKILIKGEVGSINNRDATLTSHDPDRQAYNIQFAKDLYPALVYLKTIKSIIKKIKRLESVQLGLTALTSPSAIEGPVNLRLPSTPSEAQLEPENVQAGVVWQDNFSEETPLEITAPDGLLFLDKKTNKTSKTLLHQETYVLKTEEELEIKENSGTEPTHGIQQPSVFKIVGLASQLTDKMAPEGFLFFDQTTKKMGNIFYLNQHTGNNELLEEIDG